MKKFQVRVDEDVVLKAITLSSNAQKEVIEDPNGTLVQGKRRVNIAEDGAQYVMINASSKSNPFEKARTRMYRQQQNASGDWVWPNATPKELEAFIGTKAGLNNATGLVEDYDITNAKGETRTVNLYSTIVFDHEKPDVEGLFKKLNHPLMEAVQMDEIPNEMQVAGM
jgi:hypothetical protein